MNNDRIVILLLECVVNLIVGNRRGEWFMNKIIGSIIDFVGIYILGKRCAYYLLKFY